MQIAVSPIGQLESVLEHMFRDPRLLLQALTHSSRIPERTAEDSPGDNEKLEYRGLGTNPGKVPPAGFRNSR